MFREDLFYRLNVLPITVPPLRQRKQDIQLLLDHFIEAYVAENGLSKPHLTPAAEKYLMGLEWSGNVRQLRHFVERLLVLCPENTIDLQNVKPLIMNKNQNSATSTENPTLPLLEARNQFEKKYISDILDEYNGRVAEAAKVLGMDRANLYRKMRQLGIEI